VNVAGGPSSTEKVEELTDGDLLISGDDGLFRYHATKDSIVTIGDTGRVSDVLRLKDRFVINAEKGLFVYAPLSNQIVAAGEHEWIRQVETLPNGVLIIGTEKGLFRLQPEVAQLLPIDDMGEPREIHKLSDGSLLTFAKRGWFRYDPLTQETELLREGDFNYAPDRIYDLSDGGVLIFDREIWYRYDPTSKKVVHLADIKTGIVYEVRETPDGKRLIFAEHDFLQYDPATKTISRVAGSEEQISFSFPGDVNVRNLPDGSLLIRARVGIFRYDPITARIVKLAGASLEISDMLVLLHSNVLIHIGRKWFIYSPGEALRQVGETDSARETVQLPDGSVLLSDETALFRYDPARVQIENLPEPGATREIHPLGSDALLIAAERGTFRYDVAAGRIVEVGRTGNTWRIYEVEGKLLIQGDQGWFHYEPATSTVKAIGPMGEASEIGGGLLVSVGDVLFSYDPSEDRFRRADESIGTKLQEFSPKNGGLLIRTERGLFRYDVAARRFLSTELQTGSLMEEHQLPDGDELIEAEKGWFLYTAKDGQVVPLGYEAAGLNHVDHVRDIAGVGIFIHTFRNEVYWLVEKSLADASIELVSQASRFSASEHEQEVRLSFGHPCAPVSNKLGLKLGAAYNGQEKVISPVRHPYNAEPTPQKAVLAASVLLDRPGDWKLQLRQGSRAISKWMEFPLASPSIVARISQAWRFVVAAATGLYIALFTVILFVSRRSTAALRLLTDGVFAKLIGWPLFALRNFHAIQLWVLEPWFQNVRKATPSQFSYLDPTVSSGRSSPMPASGLLSKLDARNLRQAPRVWLQGRSGMGKSSIFAAWERAFFLAPQISSLRNASHLWGFVLVPLRARDYATIPIPEPTNPETWMIEAVRRHFEGMGLSVRDRGLVEAMLKSGMFAIALDGANEADRDAAIAAFADQFPRVSLLVTSQAPAEDNWEVWRLPNDISELTEGLLGLWLGSQKGAILASRIKQIGLSESIVSGYDLRLIVEVAGSDPEHAELPEDRLALYESMFRRASDETSSVTAIDGLKQLAWSMLQHGRREISTDDEKLVGTGAFKALTRSGIRILRQRATVYEFRHDQMRAFLAASWLVQEAPTPTAMQTMITEAKIFSINRRDQDELWKFVAPLLKADTDLVSLWQFANADPETRAILVAALQAEADERGIVLSRLPKTPPKGNGGKSKSRRRKNTSGK
jgi:hypothetical protein